MTFQNRRYRFYVETLTAWRKSDDIMFHMKSVVLNVRNDRQYWSKIKWEKFNTLAICSMKEVLQKTWVGSTFAT